MEGHFIGKEEILERCGQTAVLIKDENGKIKKRSMRNIKKNFKVVGGC